jgi:hypothetical protein
VGAFGVVLVQLAYGPFAEGTYYEIRSLGVFRMLHNEWIVTMTSIANCTCSLQERLRVRKSRVKAILRTNLWLSESYY